MSPHSAAPGARSLVHRTLAATAVLAVGLSGLVTGAPAQASTDGAPAEVVMVQANIKTGMTVPKFQSDVRAVLASRPDFVTYNEVPMRQDGVLAPADYDIWRTPGRYTGATPVAWRTDTWTRIDQGTQRISNYREIPPKRHTMLGLRYANWVTLQSADGRTVSVVSAHVAPLVNGMPDLRRGTVRRIGALVTQLKARGPVFVGGDFNVHYRSSSYPRDVLTADSMVPTYDALGSYFPTGDHRGATIDYVFATADDQIQVVSQHPVELNSDHNAVVAGLSWTVDAPGQTTVVRNNPTGTNAEQRVVLNEAVDVVRSATAGETVDLVTAGLERPKVFRVLRAAVDRGVFVRVHTLSDAMTRREQALAAYIGKSSGSGAGVRQCLDSCRDAWHAGNGPRTMLLRRDTSGAPVQRADLNRFLDPTVITTRSRATVSVGNVSLTQAADLVDSLDSSAK